MDENLALNLGTDCLSVTLLIFLLCFILSDGEKLGFYRPFRRILFVTLLSFLFLCPTHFMVGKPEWNDLHILFLLFSTVISSFIFVFFARFLFQIISPEDSVQKRWLWGVDMLTGLYILLSVVPILVGEEFCDAQGHYVRGDGPFSIGFLILTCILYLCVAAILVRFWRAFQEYEIFLLLLFMVFPLFLNLQTVWLETPIYASLALAEFFLYLMICSKRNWDVNRRETEIAEKNLLLSELRGKTLLSRIQPKFLESSLLAIADLCEASPDQAREATVDFADYLRGNLRALREKKPVYFTWELEHIELYLSVERVRRKETAHVEFAVGPTGFRLPPLSVQPFVSYALQHGSPVHLATKEREDGWEISLRCDSGESVDFECMEEVSAIRTRLREQVDGTLTIERQPDGKTECIFWIPLAGGGGGSLVCGNSMKTYS